jgi:hypothetical protein
MLGVASDFGVVILATNERFGVEDDASGLARKAFFGAPPSLQEKDETRAPARKKGD